MELKMIPYDLTVCKVPDPSALDLSGEFYFIGKTDEELSLVVPTAQVPAETTEREDGWRAFRIQGVLDFSLIGILSKIAGVLTDAGISIFAVSTYNTDYILVKKENCQNALAALKEQGFAVKDE